MNHLLDSSQHLYFVAVLLVSLMFSLLETVQDYPAVVAVVVVVVVVLTVTIRRNLNPPHVHNITTNTS